MKYINYFVIGMLLGLVAIPAFSQNIIISPQRLVFEKGETSAKVMISNPGLQTENYRVEMVNLRMNENGAYEEIITPVSGELLAEDNIRFSPKRFSLSPQTAQTIRIKANIGSLPQGEYRSHLRVQIIPKTAAKIASNDKVNIGIKINYGVTLPVIIRKGILSSSVMVSNLQLHNNIAKVTMQRTGTSSVYGDVAVVFTDSMGKSYPVKQLQGISIFTPNTSRSLELPLDSLEGITSQNGTLHFKYTAPKKDGGALLAEKQIRI